MTFGRKNCLGITGLTPKWGFGFAGNGLGRGQQFGRWTWLRGQGKAFTGRPGVRPVPELDQLTNQL